MPALSETTRGLDDFTSMASEPFIAPKQEDGYKDDASVAGSMIRPKDDEEAPKAKEQGKAEKVEKKGEKAEKAEVKQKPEEKAEDDDDELDDELVPEAQPTYLRNDVDVKTVKFRENAVHVYGLDFLQTDHMNEIFSQFDHKFIEWINDSSANIIFKDAESARQALDSLSYPKNNDPPWRRTPDILVSEDSPAVFLQMRLAVAGDKKLPRHQMPKFDNLPAYGSGTQTQRKRPKPPLTPEEEAKRRKRLERFGKLLAGQPLPKPKATAEATTAADGAATAQPTAQEEPAFDPLNPTEEELARREKRASRFAEEAAAAEAAAEKKSASEKPPATGSTTDATSLAPAAAAEEPAAAPAPATDAA